MCVWGGGGLVFVARFDTRVLVLPPLDLPTHGQTSSVEIVSSYGLLFLSTLHKLFLEGSAENLPKGGESV